MRLLIFERADTLTIPASARSVDRWLEPFAFMVATSNDGVYFKFGNERPSQIGSFHECNFPRHELVLFVVPINLKIYFHEVEPPGCFVGQKQGVTCLAEVVTGDTFRVHAVESIKPGTLKSGLVFATFGIAQAAVTGDAGVMPAGPVR